MFPKKLDVLIAFKSISLAPDLSVTEKRVASAVIDHFNQKTTQCDPSIGTLSTLLGIHRRTVIRAINRLVRLNYFRRTRHGGNFHRNFYEPLWQKFREVEAEWKNRRLAHSQRFHETKLSRWKGQPEHHAGDADVTQTSLINISNEILSSRSFRNLQDVRCSSSGSQEFTVKEQCSSLPLLNRPMFHVKETRSCDAARASAERRWNSSLQKQYLAMPEVYGLILDAIDSVMQTAATEAEIKRHGAGLTYILNELKTLLPPGLGQRGKGD